MNRDRERHGSPLHRTVLGMRERYDIVGDVHGQLKALDALETAAGGESVGLEALLEAFLRPGYEAQRSPVVP